MNIKTAAVLMLSPIAVASFSGCLATSREISDLRDDIGELTIKLTDLQRNQADLSAKMDNVTNAVGPLSAELQATQSRMSLLSQRLDDVDAKMGQRLNKLSEQLSGQTLNVAAPPSEMYRMAYSDFSRGKYDVAITGFRSYLEKYPQSELASQAQFYLGECFYAQNNWAQALQEYALVEKNYPASNQAGPARLKRGLCLELLGKVPEARAVFQSVVKDYPGTPEAATAQEKLKAGQSDGKQP